MGKATLQHGRPGILGVLIFNLVFQLIFLFVLVSDVRIRFALIGISVLVVNPLLIFYLRNNWPQHICIINFMLLMIAWFLTLPLIHEMSHVIGVYAIGSKLVALRLPKFREGDFTTAWVQSEAVNDWRSPIPGLFPYIKDILLLCTGFFILKGKKAGHAFWAGFIYIFFCLGSLFDIINNYFQKLLGYVTGNDFYGVTLGWGEAWSNIIGTAFSVIGLCLSIGAFIAYKSPHGVRKWKLWENNSFRLG